MGFGNRPVSGRRVTLTRSPTASSFNAFASDSNIAIAPPKRAFSKENYINSFQIQFLPHPCHWQFRKIVRERLQDRRNRVQAVLSILSSNREKGVTYKDQDHHQHDT